MRLALFLVALLFPVKQKQVPSEAERLEQLIRSDKEVSETAIVKGANCGEYACRVNLVMKSEDGFNFQRAVFRFMQNHPEFGSDFQFEDDATDHKLTALVIYKENTLE